MERTPTLAVAAKAERIVLPGVGAFADCMNGLKTLPGMVDALSEAVLMRGVPFLGICVGMQLLADVGREFGDHPGLGWIKGDVVRMTPSDPALKIPHMGWNELAFVAAPSAVRRDRARRARLFRAFLCHPAGRSRPILATTDYGGPFAAAVGRDNIVGTQFHPEKSQAAGLTILGNFLEWTP